MIELTTRKEYDYVISRGYQPLIDWRRFRICQRLREQIQHDIFGAGDFQQENQKFYQWVWDHSIQVCAETGKPLNNYSAVFISHIISRGSDRRMACDPRNVNILSFESHRQWESPRNTTMNIYRGNQLLIRMLKNDYK